MTDQIKSGGELKDCHWCGSSPYSVPQTCQYSGPGVVHRYRILCPSCKTQTGECITPEAAIKSWQAGYAYVPLAAARTPAKAEEDGVERVARAICKANGSNPDMCVRGYSWEAGEMGKAEGGSVCYQYRWQDFKPHALAAIAALHGDQEG